MTPFVYHFFWTAIVIAFASMIAVVASIRSRRDVLANPVLTTAERPIAIQAASAALVARAAATPAVLSEFLDAYLGTAAVAKREAWERAQTDREYLKQLGTDYLAKLDDASLCRQWLQWSATPSGGIDPSERLARNQAAHCRLDSRQWGVVGGGATVLLLMLLVPPWIRQKDDITRFLFSTVDRKVLDEQFVGYRFALSPGLPDDESQSFSTGDLGKSRRVRVRSLVATPILSLQLLVLFAAVGAGVFCARRALQARSP